MSWRASLRHPVALTLLAGSVLLAGMMARVPALAPWSERAPVMVLIGILAYGAVIGVVARWPPSAPEVARLRAARREIARLLSERRESVSDALLPDWDALVGEALLRLDDEITPALVQILARRSDLIRYRATHTRGQQVPPDPAALEQLRTIQSRQDAVVASCIQRVVNAEAQLIALLQETGDTALVARLRPWVEDLAEVHAGLAHALEGQPAASAPPPDLAPVPIVDTVKPLAEYPVGLGERPGLEDLVRDALQQLNKPASLARCELAARLPRTLATVRKSSGEVRGTEVSPLEQSHALREVLLDAIERLRPADEEASAPSLQYYVLREAYVLGMSTKHVMVRHAISEATLHRRRHEGIRVLAEDLGARELRLARRFDPVALDYLG